MPAFYALCEAPVCALDFIMYEILQHEINPVSYLLDGFVLDLSLSNSATIASDLVGAYGFDIAHTVSVAQELSPTLIYNETISHVMTLTQQQVENVIYAVAITHATFLTSDFKINNVYNIELCDGVEVYQKLGWIIELDFSNSVTCTVEELQGLYTDLVINHAMETNMDDTTCLNPTGKSTDYSANTNVNVAQSLDGKFIYVCNMETNMSLLSSVAWR